MATTHEEIRSWLKTAQGMDATHMIVACDTFNWEDYPVYVRSDKNVKDEEKRIRGSKMQKVMEVYSLTGKHDLDEQLEEERAFHFD